MLDTESLTRYRMIRKGRAAGMRNLIQCRKDPDRRVLGAESARNRMLRHLTPPTHMAERWQRDWCVGYLQIMEV